MGLESSADKLKRANRECAAVRSTDGEIIARLRRLP